MDRLIAGVAKFQRDIYPAREALFHRLDQGQHPRILFITCSDSRIDPDLITQAEPGELFVLRNAGNLVPPHNAVFGGGEAATIEYAITILQVAHIIICGHSHCGAMHYLIAHGDPHHPQAPDSHSSLGPWISHAETTRQLLLDDYGHEDEATIESKAERLNVIVQLNHLKTLPTVARALSKGEVSLHGWFYQIDCGQIDCYDPVTEEFKPLVAKSPL